MVDIPNCYSSIFNASKYFSTSVVKHSIPSKQNHIITSGDLNYMWQSWNGFWRSFWLAYLLGGRDLLRNPISPYRVFANSGEAIYYLLYLLGKKSNPTGTIRGSFQEPTWGDLDTIRGIASASHSHRSDLARISDRVIGALNALGDTPRHFQKVRNCSIHLDSDTITDVSNNVQPYYSIRHFKYPTEILFSRELSTGKLAYQHWIDELLAVISIIYIS